MSRRTALALMVLALGSCGPDQGPGGPGGRRDLSGIGGDAAGAGDDLMSIATDDMSVDTDGDVDGDVASFDGPSAYDDLGGKSDSGACLPPNTGATCAAPIASNAGCTATENCGPGGAGNGLDDNCDGRVDEGCACTPGAVEPCFLGPPGKHLIGACSDGTQTCQGAEFGTWGDCKGSIAPSAERCDKLDNDCNGCADDGLCCDATLACPASVPDVQPYSTVTYNGASYFKGNAMTWSWTVDGGPCDQLFKTTTGTPPTQSYTLTGANTAMPSLKTTLSGDYTVTMTVVGTDGKTYTCKWVQHVTGPGLRFELCWDHTGTSTQAQPPPGADLDLHIHRPGTTTAWFGTSAALPSADDCNYDNCTANAFLPPAANVPAWSLANSNLSVCKDTTLGSTWTTVTYCHNPRLDLDNVSQIGVPENTNIDDPANGQTFRALVHYYGQDGSSSTNNVEEHPIVNVYCGGHLKATYGQAPNTLGPCPGAACFNHGSGWNAGQMWRVADVTVAVDAAGNTTDCTVAPIHPPGTAAGYYVTTNSSVY